MVSRATRMPRAIPPTGPTTDSAGKPHGGPHWDVQSKRYPGRYRNVYPGGLVR
ncbi:polymorphic toxin type 37 domain-containing protein [Stenotrophomonas indicatrix]|uniref:polymorphic toxin type 37 domain-containing protein n=1 Tax=Stenotrophomonas indicatrix TaxID=2045451 RepID=UPI003D0B2B3B